MKADHYYVKVLRSIAQDATLSFAARGVLVYLLSKPKGWNPSIPDLINASPNQKEYVQSCMRELKNAGYAVLKKTFRNGVLTGSIWEINEHPRQMGKPVVGDAFTDNGLSRRSALPAIGETRRLHSKECEEKKEKKEKKELLLIKEKEIEIEKGTSDVPEPLLHVSDQKAPQNSGAPPKSTTFLLSEFGCGENLFGEKLVQMGFPKEIDYVGLYRRIVTWSDRQKKAPKSPRWLEIIAKMILKQSPKTDNKMSPKTDDKYKITYHGF